MESAGNSEEVDRLSALPTPLLQDILSLLPTKDAVKTCILSKRWKGIWIFIDSLDFNDESSDDRLYSPSASPWSSDDEVEQQQQEKTQFPDFVDRALLCRDGSNLRKFRLCFNIAKWGVRCADKWLGYAVRHSVQQIELCLDDCLWMPFGAERSSSMTPFESEQYHLPRELFACKSLTDMNLRVQDGYLQLPTSIDLPNLQSIELTSLTVPGECVQQMLCCCPKLKIFNLTKCKLPDAEIFDVSGCSRLENLILKRNRLRHVKMINISGPELKSLTIRNSSKRNSVARYSHSLNIAAPNLLYLEYNYRLMEKPRIENLPNLLNAVICWDLGPSSIDESILPGLELLKGLEHVRTMRLHHSFMKIVSRVEYLRLRLGTSFTNLKFLELLISKVSVDEFKAIAWLLECCPSIETLVIEIKGGTDGGDLESDYFPYECKLYNLKEVDLRESEESNIKHCPQKLLQKIALVLEKIIVTAPNIDQQRRKKFWWKELVTQPRASLKLSIQSS